MLCQFTQTLMLHALALSRNVNGGLNSGFSISGSFQRAATSAQTVGKQDGTTLSYINYGVKHMLDLLERQVKRQEECMALGMWEFATYVISHDYNTASNVAHMYLSLTQGENGGSIAWKEVTKIVILKNLVIFYMGKVRAHLLPLDQLPEAQADAVTEAILADASGMKIVNKRKKRRK